MEDCNGARVCYVGEREALVYMTSHSSAHCSPKRYPTKRSAASDQVMKEAGKAPALASLPPKRAATHYMVSIVGDMLTRCDDDRRSLSKEDFVELHRMSREVECAAAVERDGNAGRRSLRPAEQAKQDYEFMEYLETKFAGAEGGAGFIFKQRAATQLALDAEFVCSKKGLKDVDDSRFIVIHQSKDELDNFKELQRGGKLHERCNFCTDVDYKVVKGYMTMYLSSYDSVKEKLITFGGQRTFPSPGSRPQHTQLPPLLYGTKGAIVVLHKISFKRLPLAFVGTMYVYKHGQKNAQVRRSTMTKLYTALRDRLRDVFGIQHLSIRKFTNDGEYALWTTKYWLLKHNHFLRNRSGQQRAFYCEKQSADGSPYFCSWNEQTQQYEGCEIGDIPHVVREMRMWVKRFKGGNKTVETTVSRKLFSLLKMTRMEEVMPTMRAILEQTRQHLGEGCESSMSKFLLTILKYARRFIPACMPSSSLVGPLRISWTEQRNAQVQHRGSTHLPFHTALRVLLTLHLMARHAPPKRAASGEADRRKRAKRHRANQVGPGHDQRAGRPNATSGFSELGLVRGKEESTSYASTVDLVAGKIRNPTIQTYPSYHKMSDNKFHKRFHRLDLAGSRQAGLGCDDRCQIHASNVRSFEHYENNIHFVGDSHSMSNHSGTPWFRVIHVCTLTDDGVPRDVGVVRIGRGCSCNCAWFNTDGQGLGLAKDCRHIFYVKKVYFGAFCDLKRERREMYDVSMGALHNAVTNFFLSPIEVHAMMQPISAVQYARLGAWRQTNAYRRGVQWNDDAAGRLVEKEVGLIRAENTHVTRYTRSYEAITCIPISTGPSVQNVREEEKFRYTYINLGLGDPKWVDEATAKSWPGFAKKDALKDTEAVWASRARFQHEAPHSDTLLAMEDWTISRSPRGNRCSGCTNRARSATERCTGNAGRRALRVGELVITCVGDNCFVDRNDDRIKTRRRRYNFCMQPACSAWHTSEEITHHSSGIRFKSHVLPEQVIDRQGRLQVHQGTSYLENHAVHAGEAELCAKFHVLP